MCLIYGLNYLDSNEPEPRRLCEKSCLQVIETTISYASIMGLKEDLNLVRDNYQWLGSLFYFGKHSLITHCSRVIIAASAKPSFHIGYLGWEFPTNRLMQRLPLAKYTAFNVIMWGLVLALFAVTENFAGAVVIRLFLGIFEAAVTPGFALFTSQVCLPWPKCVP